MLKIMNYVNYLTNLCYIYIIIIFILWDKHIINLKLYINLSTYG